jgi:hypothetical protein
MECDKADWLLCGLIESEEFIFMPAKDPKDGKNG